MEQTWFITGSSRGFGRALVRAALHAGHRVAATARRPEELDDLVDEFGDHIHPIRLDVTDVDLVRAAVTEAHTVFGGIDVVVNNAGYANVAPIETGDDSDFRTQFETNFWGVYNVSKAVIPLLRQQGHGLIIQFSSVGGRVGGSGGIASYQAAKFAIDGFSRVLRSETAQFGVRVLVVEPSGFRTDWAGSSMTVSAMSDGYSALGARYSDSTDPASPLQAGDPERAAAILVEVAARQDIPHNLPLGAQASALSVEFGRRQLDSDLAWQEVSRSADFGLPYPVTPPPDGVPAQSVPSR
ncbi:SDR family NAD(P)-dependent oxidoreductase [Gordonia sp. SID5947]|uniref:SDR family NAD(P)-dependent oxidoreductase n=1 Tax=Gordonia sp. SID5947 TaxID=2690315 RepID=UPI001368AFE6|nr:SDR family NAD(P)-dependent oxidoreductase [Gordonia sp. SID5947]MYR06633.1 SDR family NAD(P)-dependent oxidoreductase [Gordonia sp. SID5947]